MGATSAVTKGTTTNSGDPTVVQKISQLPRFFVHFRRAESVALSNPISLKYKGEFGFDWLRDEYIYDVNMVHALNKHAALFQGETVSKLIEQYTHFNRKPIEEIKEILTYNDDPYIPSWLSLEEGREIGLYLHIDLATTETTDLTQMANLNLSFEYDPLLVELMSANRQYVSASPLTVSLRDVIGSTVESEQNLISSKQDLKSKKIKRFETQFKINVKILKSFSKPQFIKIKAMDGNRQSQVGLLVLYPNDKILQARLQMIYFTPNSRHSALIPTKDLEKVIKDNFFVQALIKPVFDNPISINIANEMVNPIRTQKDIKLLNEFLNKYPANQNIPQNNVTNFYTDVFNLIKYLYKDTKSLGVHNSKQKVSYVIVADYTVANFGGFTPIRTRCTNGLCKTEGNTVFVTNTSSGYDFKLTSFIHELGHAFGLKHTFDGNDEKIQLCLQHKNTHTDTCKRYQSAYQKDDILHKFYQGYTDNVMDYGFSIKEDCTQDSCIGTNPSSFLDIQLALTKWQWDILREDANIGR